MADVNNPVSVLYTDSTSGRPVAVSDDAPLPVTTTGLEALFGTADDAAGTNTVIGLLKQIAENTAP